MGQTNTNMGIKKYKVWANVFFCVSLITLIASVFIVNYIEIIASESLYILILLSIPIILFSVGMFLMAKYFASLGKIISCFICICFGFAALGGLVSVVLIGYLGMPSFSAIKI